MFRILIIIFCFLSFPSFANEYKVSLLGLELIPEAQRRVISINDKGQVLGSYQDSHDYRSIIYLFDSKNGLTFIEAKDQSLFPTTTNNLGQVLGFGNKPFIWSKTFGLRWLDIFNSTCVQAQDINDLGQIIGSYQPVGSNEAMRPFMWDYGVVTDMGPGSEFSKSIEFLGYHIMEIRLMSINNKGELVGYFAYGKYNEKKKKYVRVGYECFYWDGDMQILPVPVELTSPPNTMSVNNHGSIMISIEQWISYTTYLSNVEVGFIKIPNFFGRVLNDANIILGYEHIDHPNLVDCTAQVVWRNGVVSSISELLGVTDINQLAPSYSDNYDIEALSDFVDINNKGQIPCTGFIWGDAYPCLLEPIKKKDSLSLDLKAFMDDYSNCTDTYKGSKLCYAIKHKYQDILSHLISQVPKSDNDSLNCLFVAAESGNTEAISLMAEAGWDIKVRKKPFNETLLHQAAQFGNPDTCQELINLGLNVNDMEMYAKQSPLYLTTRLSINATTDLEKKNALKAARVLINNGADPNIRTECGSTPLISLCGGNHDFAFVEFLLASGAEPNLTYADGVSPLHLTIGQTERGDMTERQKIVNLLLENGADVYQCTRGNDFYCPIAIAISVDDSAVIEILIKYGVDLAKPIRVSQFGNTYPLDYAMRLNKKKAIAFLNKYGAKKSP